MKKVTEIKGKTNHFPSEGDWIVVEYDDMKILSCFLRFTEMGNIMVSYQKAIDENIEFEQLSGGLLSGTCNLIRKATEEEKKQISQRYYDLLKEPKF